MKIIFYGLCYVIIALAVVPLLLAHLFDSFGRTAVDVYTLHRYVRSK